MAPEAVSHVASGMTADMRMRIAIRTGGIPSQLAALARRRLEYALGRFGTRIRSVTVRLADVNGPRGGVDKTCVIAVRLEPARRLIVIEDIDADAPVAIDRAADRAARAVARALHARSDWRSMR